MKTILFVLWVCFTLSSVLTKVDEAQSKNVLSNGCECVVYNCGCCQDIFVVKTNTLCVNATYLDQEYGISVTMTFNNFTILNETVSARNPPPICIGEDIVDYLEVELCLKIYDIYVEIGKLHLCFQVNGMIARLKAMSLKLGCVNIQNFPGMFKTNYFNRINGSSIKSRFDEMPTLIVV